MTRINSSIKVKFLTDEHLLAEHREIKRLPFVYKKRLESKNGFENIPEKFTLGKGHVLFFINKNKFTFKRYKQIHKECLKRGFEPGDYKDNWLICKKHFNDYSPTQEEHKILIERITQRLIESRKKQWHYYSKPISKEEAIKLLTNEKK